MLSLRRKIAALAALAFLASLLTSTPAVAQEPNAGGPNTESLLQAPVTQVEVYARGQSGAEVAELRIDGVTRATFNLTTQLAPYTFSTSQAIGPRSLAVHFVNDAPVATGDRAITIDRVVVNGRQFQTEGPATQQLGAWRNGSCRNLGVHRLETLTCNGFARYSIGTAGQPQRPAGPAPQHPDLAFPPAGSNGAVGCIAPCETVGFQDLDGARNVVLENVIITNPGGACLSIRGARNVTIRNVTMRNCGTQTTYNNRQGNRLVTIANSENVTITNSSFVNNSTRAATNRDLFHLHDTRGFTFSNNVIRNVASDTNGAGPDSGNRAFFITGNNTSDLSITQNSMFSPGRNAVQISRARQIENVSITRNRIEGRGPWDSDFEDMINFFSTTGTPDSPILVRRNYLRNGGPSPTGTAIILGDGRDRQGTGNINVVENVIVDPGHVGINIVSGFNFTVRDNIVFGNADVGLWTATGLAIHHHRFTPACRDHRVWGNRVFFRNQFPQHSGTNHVWIPGTCTNGVRVHSNRFGDRTLSYDVWNLPN